MMPVVWKSRTEWPVSELATKPPMNEPVMPSTAVMTKRFALTADTEEELLPITQIEQRYVERVLALLSGNKSRTAQALGIDRRTLYRKLEAWTASVRT